MKTIVSEKTQYGFVFGPAEVQRICSDAKHGVWLRVIGEREELEIRVTNGGRIRAGKPVRRK